MRATMSSEEVVCNKCGQTLVSITFIRIYNWVREFCWMAFLIVNSTFSCRTTGIRTTLTDINAWQIRLKRPINILTKDMLKHFLWIRAYIHYLNSSAAFNFSRYWIPLLNYTVIDHCHVQVVWYRIFLSVQVYRHKLRC